MRQRCYVGRYPERCELFIDVVPPATRALETVPETITKSMLVADAFHSLRQRLVSYVFGPQRQYACFFSTQVVALSRCERAQNRLYLLAPFVDSPVSFAPRRLFGHIKSRIDNRKIAIIVQHTLIDRVLRKYRYPEVDIGLQFRRQGK